MTMTITTVTTTSSKTCGNFGRGAKRNIYTSKPVLHRWFFTTLIILSSCRALHVPYIFFTPYQREKKTKPRKQQYPLQVVPLVDDSPSIADNNDGVNDDEPLLDWDASGSIGSLLMQMQKKEEEMRKLNKTLLDKENSVDLSSPSTPLSSSSSSSSTSSTSSFSSSPQPGNITDEEVQEWTESRKSKLTRMNYATAKELDDAVSIRIPSIVGSETKVLELPSLYKVLLSNEEEQPDTNNDLPPLSKPSHYYGRIGRDMRHLAVSIASCIDDPSDWRLFCQQLQPSGGLRPLLDCIHEGAASVREGQQQNAAAQKSDLIQNKYEESFLAASSACRALRDLCGMSLDLAAVITDGLLRANVAAAKDGPSLVDDLCTLLKYADENSSDIALSSRKKQRLKLRRRKKPSTWGMNFLRKRNEEQLKCKLYVTQLLLAMTCASDSAVDALRANHELRDTLLRCSSYDRKQKTRRWLRYPGELFKWVVRSKRKDSVEPQRRRPFIEATALGDDLADKVKGTANQILAALGYNQWVPKIPGQKGLRILSLDGGGSRGMTSVVALDCLVQSLGGVEVADCFDLVVGTSTGAIIAFLVGIKKETSKKAVQRYDDLIGKIFTKTALSTPLLLFTTATYDESPFMTILSDILKDYTMLDSRADPAVPYVFAVTSKMSSTPTHVALFRNYNYNGGELPDPFMIKPEEARENLGLPLDLEDNTIKSNNYPKRTDKKNAVSPGIKQVDGSRHPGSFRVLQRYALRASTAAPTVFKPVLMGGEMYCDGGIVASNPTAIGIHEARNLFPNIPIELIVSIGTGGFLEQKSAPRIGWDGIIGQIVGSATDGEQIHHILEDILGEGGTAQLGRSSVSNTCYMRFNPVLGLPDSFPIDVTDPEKLELLKQIARDYMEEPEQKRKIQDIADLLQGRRGIRKWFRR